MIAVTENTKIKKPGTAKTASEVDKNRVKKQSQHESLIKNQCKPKTGTDKLKVKLEKRKVAKTALQTLPYVRVCDNYIFQAERENFSRSYKFDDMNYTASDEDEQERIARAYQSLMTGLDSTTDLQITLHNNHISQKEFERRILLREKNDGREKFRKEYNNMLREKLQQGGIVCKKYLTVTVSAVDLETAKLRFGVLDIHIRTCFQKIGTQVSALTAGERCRILADVFRGANVEISEISEDEFQRGGEKSLCCPAYKENI